MMPEEENVYSPPYSFILGLDKRAARKPNKIAADMPPAVAVIPPVNIPRSPDSLTAFIVPFARE